MQKADQTKEEAIMRGSSPAIEEDEILECIDDSLNSVGRTIAYTVYLNWNAINQERHLGILGDPQTFGDSLYPLFGENDAKKIVELLVRNLQSRFPYVKVKKQSAGSNDVGSFVSLMITLRHLASSTDDDEI